MTILVDDPKAVFIHVPKNAGTSISHWLRTNLDSHNVKRKHDSYEAIKIKYGEDLGFSFAVIRNPWDRIVSSFHYNKRVFASGRYDNLEEKIKKTKNSNKKQKFAATKRLKDIIEQDSFNLFVKSKIYTPVNQLQVDFTQGVDQILYYENLDKDFQMIKDFFNIQKDLPYKNKSEHKIYRSYYNDKTKDIIYKVFYRDIKKYNYEF